MMRASAAVTIERNRPACDSPRAGRFGRACAGRVAMGRRDGGRGMSLRRQNHQPRELLAKELKGDSRLTPDDTLKSSE